MPAPLEPLSLTDLCTLPGGPLTLGAVPRPADHPRLAGPAAAEARAALEVAFGPSQEVALGEQLLILDAQGPVAELLFVESGALRGVRVQSAGRWVRGRDPRVVDLLGPGCFANLPLAAGLLAGPDTPLPTTPSEGLAWYAHADWEQGDAPEPVRVRRLPLTRLDGLLRAHPLLRAWLTHLVDVAWTRRVALRTRLRQSPLLSGLGLPDYNALLSCAALATAAPVMMGGVRTTPVGGAVEATLFLLDGSVQLRSADDAWVGSEAPGGILFAGTLTQEGPAVAPAAARVRTAGGRYLAWDRLQAQRVLRRAPAVWARLRSVALPMADRPDTTFEDVVAVVEDDPSGTTAALLAAGIAATLATVDPDRQVCLVSVGAGAGIAAALGAETPAGADVPATGDGGRSLRVPGWSNLQVRVGVAPGSAIRLVEALRATPEIRQVVLHLDALPLPFQRPIRRSNPAAAGHPPDTRGLLLDGLRRIPHQVVWVNADPDGWWTLTDEAPDRLLRVDRLTAPFVAGLRERTENFTAGGVAHHDLSDDRPGCRPDHQVILRHRPEEDEAVAHGGLAAALLAARPGARSAPVNVLAEACWRLCRMIRGRSVGLALGGGGVWGAAHIGVIAALEEAGVPVDYVAGTSFGTVVGSVYAGGGLAALRQMAHECRLPPARSLPERLLSRAGPLAMLGDQLRSSRTPLGEAMWRAQTGSDADLGRMVERLVGADRGTALTELAIPFQPVGSNLTRQVAYSPYWVDLATAVTASGSLPPAFPSVLVRREVIVDGAPLANVPAQALRDRGADYVIAVNVVGADRLGPEGGEGAAARPRPTGLGPREWVRRARETWAVTWLALWKAGVDQARLAADVLIDLHVTGAAFSEIWRTEEVAARAEAIARADGLGARVHTHWSEGVGRPFLEIVHTVEVGGSPGDTRGPRGPRVA